MDEMNKNPSDETNTATTMTAPARNLIRSRLRAAPNVAISSGLARTRRLSGHFTSNTEKTIQQVSVEASTDKKILNQRSRSPSINASPDSYDLNENSRETIINTQFNSVQQSPLPILKPKSPAAYQHQQQHQQLHEIGNPRVSFISKINSPNISTTSKTDRSDALNVVQGNQSAANLSFRQFVNYQSNFLQQKSSVNLVPLSPSVCYNQPPTPILMPCTPGGTEYNPKFSNEHIMNIIKHKSMQKLKKIEAEVNSRLISI